MRFYLQVALVVVADFGVEDRDLLVEVVELELLLVESLLLLVVEGGLLVAVLLLQLLRELFELLQLTRERLVLHLQLLNLGPLHIAELLPLQALQPLHPELTDDDLRDSAREPGRPKGVREYQGGVGV